MNKNGALSSVLQGYRQRLPDDTGTSSPASSGSCSSGPQCSSSRSASYYSRICPAPADRLDWKDLKLGWLLSDTLDGPRLVFRDRDLWRAHQLEQLLDEQRSIFYAARRGIARNVPDARKDYARAVEKLKRLHAGLVELAVGYFLPFAAVDGRRPLLFAFQDYIREALGPDV